MLNMMKVGAKSSPVNTIVPDAAEEDNFWNVKMVAMDQSTSSAPRAIKKLEIA